jgi:hypothetical protein
MGLFVHEAFIPTSALLACFNSNVSDIGRFYLNKDYKIDTSIYFRFIKRYRIVTDHKYSI